jgi:hypothetical protein
VVERTESTLVLAVELLEHEGKLPRNTRLCFVEPSSEWSMLWDSQNKQWKQHPEPAHPLGEFIVEAFVKPSHVGLLFSFAGNHPMGWSRWGFTASGVWEC